MKTPDNMIVTMTVGELRQIIREENEKLKEEFLQETKLKELPPLLTRKELMELLHISHTKATELIGRPDFPTFRKAGLLIPTDMLFEWIRRNTDWVETNTSYFKSVI